MATRVAGFVSPILPASPKAEDWDYFHRQFTSYLVIVDATAAQRLSFFLNCLGRDGLLLFDGLPSRRLHMKRRSSGLPLLYWTHFSFTT